MARKLNVERMKRYRLRTMTEPDRSIVLTAQEMEAHEDYSTKWVYADDWVEPPRSVQWFDQVRAFCQAKGIRASLMVQENDQDMSWTLTWEPSR